jgi:ribokinase
MSGRIISMGSIIVDLAIRVPALPERGGDVLGSRPELAVGGGFNLMSAAKRQGAMVVYGGVVGVGDRGTMVLDSLTTGAIEVGQPPISGLLDTGVCVTLIEDQGERTFITSPGAEAVLTSEGLAGLHVEAGDWVAVSGYDLAYEQSAGPLAGWIESLPPSVNLFLDPGPLVREIDADVWTRVVHVCDVLSVNEQEAASIAGGLQSGSIDDLHRAVRQNSKLRDSAYLVIRRGPAGSSVDGGHLLDLVEVGAPVVEARDTTGAGDTHAGVLVADLATGSPIETALQRANVAAAVAVTRYGPATAPLRTEVDEILSAMT